MNIGDIVTLTAARVYDPYRGGYYDRPEISGLQVTNVYHNTRHQRVVAERRDGPVPSASYDAAAHAFVLERHRWTVVDPYWAEVANAMFDADAVLSGDHHLGFAVGLRRAPVRCLSRRCAEATPEDAAILDDQTRRRGMGVWNDA